MDDNSEDKHQCVIMKPEDEAKVPYVAFFHVSSSKIGIQVIRLPIGSELSTVKPKFGSEFRNALVSDLAKCPICVLRKHRRQFRNGQGARGGPMVWATGRCGPSVPRFSRASTSLRPAALETRTRSAPVPISGAGVGYGALGCLGWVVKTYHPATAHIRRLS